MPNTPADIADAKARTAAWRERTGIKADGYSFEDARREVASIQAARDAAIAAGTYIRPAPAPAPASFTMSESDAELWIADMQATHRPNGKAMVGASLFG